jgi:hypothetical protein
MMRRIELPGDGLSDTDMRALQDAVALSRASGQVRSEQITGMFDQREWFAVATFCAFDSQKRTLGAKQWEPVPMHVADPDNPKPGEEDAAPLLGEMLARGISRYHPDPRRALAEAEAQERDPNPLQAAKAAEAERVGSPPMRASRCLPDASKLPGT